MVGIYAGLPQAGEVHGIVDASVGSGVVAVFEGRAMTPSAGTRVNINVVATDRPGGMAVDSKMKSL